MPFIALALLFLFGSGWWGRLHAVRPPRAAPLVLLDAGTRERLVAERTAGYCKVRIDAAAEEVATELHLCPSLLESSATRYRAEVSYRGSGRDYQVSVNALYPVAGEHDWRDRRGSALRDAAFHFSKEQGHGRVEISGFEPGEGRRLAFVHRFVVIADDCLAESARLAALSDAALIEEPLSR